MNKDDITNNSKDVLRKLFIEAKKEGGLQYIFTLLRVSGITCCEDPLIKLESILNEQELLSLIKDSTVQSCLFDGMEELLSMIGNLLNCCAGQAYKFYFFHPLYKGSFPNIVKPSVEQMLKEVKDRAMQANHSEIASVLDYSSLTSLFEETPKTTEYHEGAKSFVQDLMGVYKEERLKFKDRSKFCKMPRFDVLELKVNKDEGLYGFYLHFSNGRSAHFIRKIDSTESVNISHDREYELVPFVGDLDALTEEWRVGEKKLYEIGLPGRYNKFGEWKPIIYPGNTDNLQKYVRQMTEDPEIQGVLFYMSCTGHRVFEFVMKATLDIPLDQFSIGEKIHFWKCPPTKGFYLKNAVIYDGYVELEHSDPEYIRSAIDQTGIVINRLAFAYDADVTWRLKYRMIASTGHLASPEKEDLGLFDSLLKEFPQTQDADILLSAIDWYNRGRSSSNIFTSFLCYYISMESVANAIAEGNANLGIDYSRESKKKRKELRNKCIQEKYAELYEKDPAKFVSQSYFDCVIGLKKRTQQIVAKVFGEDHEYLKILFEKNEPNEKSLQDVRSEIAHGRIALHNKEDMELVQANLYNVKKICKDFLTRLIFSLKPEDSPPSWSGYHSSSFASNDPRTFLVISDEKCIPSPDWKIKEEWCEE